MSDRAWIGQSVKRVEDLRLLTGRGTFIDDHPPVANVHHAAIVRSPHAHARIHGYDVTAALRMEGVVAVLTGAEVAKACKPFGVGVTAPVHYYPSATDKARFVGEPVAVVVAVLVTVGAAASAVGTGAGAQVVWLGGWSSVRGRPIGIALVADRPALLLLCLVGVLTLVALIWSWHFRADTGASYVVLVVVFLGSCSGFVLTGDVFDAFVWFELMGVAAYALTGMRVEEPRSVHGALSFGIVNTVGASLSLTGIAVLYARTGELNLASMGEALRRSPADDLVVVACALLLTGVLVKMALVPFHFWTADAEAVAPTPVCVLLSGAMITVAAFAVARWWWVVFSGVVPDDGIRHALVGIGAATGLVGAVMCACQRHLKRLLAYSTVAHSGIIACGIGLLSGPGLAAAGLYAVGHACTKGALFLVTGELLGRHETLDEHELYRRGRRMRVGGATFLVGALALAGFPAVGTWAGKAVFTDALGQSRVVWLELVLVLVSALTGGSVLRAGLRIFLGLGDPPDPGPPTHEEPEGDRPSRRHATRVVVPPVVLLALPSALAVVPGVAAATYRAAARVTDTVGYTRAVLHASPGGIGRVPTEGLWHVSTIVPGIVAVLIALGFAAFELWPSRRPRPLRWLVHPVGTGVRLLHAVHRAHVGDYVSWVLVGFTVLGVTMLLS